MDTSQNMETRKYLENPGQSRHVFCFSFLERMTLWKGKLIWFWLFHIIQYFKCTVCYLCLVQFTDMIDVKWQHHLSSYYLIQMHWCWDVLKRAFAKEMMTSCCFVHKLTIFAKKRHYCVYTNIVLVLKMAWCWFVLEKSAVVTQFTDIVLLLRWLDGGLFWKSHRRCNCGDRVERVASALVALWSLSPSWFLAKSTRIIKTFEIHSFCWWNITPTLCC